MQEVAERTGAGAAGGAGGARTTRTRAMGTPVEGSRPGRPSLPPRQPGDEMHRVAARRHSGGETADDLPHPARVLVVRAVDGDAQGVPFISRSERTSGRCKAGPHSRNGA